MGPTNKHVCNWKSNIKKWMIERKCQEQELGRNYSTFHNRSGDAKPGKQIALAALEGAE